MHRGLPIISGAQGHRGAGGHPGCLGVKAELHKRQVASLSQDDKGRRASILTYINTYGQFIEVQIRMMSTPLDR